MENRFNELVIKSLTHEISEGEEAELDLLLQKSELRRKEYALLRDIDTLFNIRDGVEAENLQRMKGSLLQKMDRSGENRETFVPNRSLGQGSLVKKLERKWDTRWVRYAAVLIPLFAVLSITAWYFSGKEVEVVQLNQMVLAQNILPGTAKAYLSAGEDTVVLQGSHLSVADIPEVIAMRVVEQRVLTVPRGAEYEITLEDGTNVWLGPDSRFVYPAKFSRAERVVELEGEAFFEVTPNKIKPFVVKTKDVLTKVLGTSFSLTSYPDNTSVKSILVTGAVKMIRGAHTAFLEPGKGADFNLETGTVKVSEVNVRKAMALKEGRFFFDDEPLADIFTQLERWYNVQISTTSPEIGKIRFYGVIRKDRDFSFIMEMMRQTYKLDFKIEGNRIDVIKRMN